MAERKPFADDLDSIGPFHPYTVTAAVLLLDLILILLVLTSITFVGDRLEDVIWPGGKEWVDL